MISFFKCRYYFTVSVQSQLILIFERQTNGRRPEHYFLKMLNKYFRLAVIASITSICLFGNFKVFSQNVSYDLPLINNIQYQPFFANPGFRHRDQTTFLGNFHSYLGAFSDVNYTNMALIRALNEKRTLGASFLHEATSDFFSRTRIYGVYQEHVNLYQETFISAGIQVGVINFNMKALGGTAGGSAWAPDIGIGVTISNPRYQSGISLRQISKPRLRPIEYEFQLNRLLETNFSYKFELAPFVSFIPDLRFRVHPDESPFNINNQIQLYDQLGFAVNYFYQRGISCSASYRSKEGDSKGFQFFVSYFFPGNNLKYVDAYQIEFGLNLYFNKESKGREK